jgi:stalled ribosome alternative rescue factor ArfA
MVDLWPHQWRVVEETAKAFPDGRLLCDEVGMGKTIEAILVLRRLLCGRGVKRSLLLVPAGLLKQWQDELREKGGLLVPRWESGYLYFPNGEKKVMEAAEALSAHDILLLSREWARLENNRNVVLNAPAWDLVLLDEAHAARRSAPEEREFNSGNLLLQLLRELQLRRRTMGIFLLSATPMQTQPWEPWDLLAVLGVGGKWLVEFSDLRTYYKGITDLGRGILSLPTATAISQLVASDNEFPEPQNDPDKIGIFNIQTNDPLSVANALVFAFGEQQRLYAEWLRRGAPLGRRMHRNTRDTLRRYYEKGLLAHRPPRRDVRDEVFDYQEQAERDFYNAIADYINERYEQLEKEKKGKGFVMTIYRRRAASSPNAIRCSLNRRFSGLERVIRRQWAETWLSLEDEQIDQRDLIDADIDEQIDSALPSDPKKAEAEKKEIEALLNRLDAIGGTDSKFSNFWSVLQEVTADGRAVLVFTEYTDTMTYLREQLAPAYGNTLGCYCGAGGQVLDGGVWVGVSKADIAERLTNGELKVLICTDAASEGLNLQTAGALINYDLPWNPSKVEQRIGRIDRIGQVQPVLPIRNLFLKDSVDMRVYQVLRQRCRLFEHFVGKMQPVLALARDALRRNLRDEETEAFLKALHRVADEVDKDETVASTFIESDVEARPSPVPPVTLKDIETALSWLEKTAGRVKAVPVEVSSCWRLTGFGNQPVEVTTAIELLERDNHLVPLTVGTEIMQLLAANLTLPSLAPLVLTEHTSAAYRCIEARWVQPDGVTVVASATQLIALINSWDGELPPPALLVKARNEADDTARRRIVEMLTKARLKEEANLRRQVEAARYRLLRELGRTLRCIGTGDLNALFRQQVQRDSHQDGRYHRALNKLGGYPVWTDTEIEAINQFVESLKSSQRQARLLGSEVDAALDDPRWQAKVDVADGSPVVV